MNGRSKYLSNPFALSVSKGKDWEDILRQASFSKLKTE
jgi:hypothetical protein